MLPEHIHTSDRDEGATAHTFSTAILLLAVSASITVGAVPVAGQDRAGEPEQARIVLGGTGLEARNGPIELGEGTVIIGPIHTRNGSISVGARSETGELTSRNGRIHLGASTVVSGSVETRNGAITLGPGASVRGHVESRNGRVELDEDVRVEGSIDARNGRVQVGTDARIRDDIRTRNGGVTMEPGAWVGGDIATRNGSVRLEDARVVRSIDTHGGSLDLMGTARVDGDVIVLMPEQGWLSRIFSFGSRDSQPVVRIDSGVSIGGRLILDERARLELAAGADVPEPERYPGRSSWEGRRR